MYWADETRFGPIANAMSRNVIDTMRNYFYINENRLEIIQIMTSCVK
jgi:hypothetical protein